MRELVYLNLVELITTELPDKKRDLRFLIELLKYTKNDINSEDVEDLAIIIDDSKSHTRKVIKEIYEDKISEAEKKLKKLS